MTIDERYEEAIKYFSVKYPNPQTELHYGNPYQLLVAVILSAQCTDKRVNIVTPALFERLPDFETLAQSNFYEVFPLIKSISYPNNKTKHLLGMAKMVVEDFGGKLPMDVAELMKLPGVGRKTANVITAILDHQPNMPVDTHVFRVSARIGLTWHAKTPLDTEKQLVRHFPKELIIKAHHWLILHGRYICVAGRPKCEECGLQHACRYFQEVMKPIIEKEQAEREARALKNKSKKGKAD